MSRQSRKISRSSAKADGRSACLSVFGRVPLLTKIALRFGAYLGLFYLCSLSVVGGVGISALARGYVVAANGIVQSLGENSSTHGETLFSHGRPILTVVADCTATEFVGMCCAAMLAFPAPIVWRLGGILAGMAWLALLSLLRVVSLYLVGVHLPRIFELAHDELWPAILVIGTLSILLAWFNLLARKGHV